MSLIYSERGGGTMANRRSTWALRYCVTWPFAKFELHEDKIVLNVWFRQATIPLQQISLVKRLFFFPILFDLVSIGESGDAPRWLSFFSFNATKIMTLLKERGVPVKSIGLKALPGGVYKWIIMIIIFLVLFSFFRPMLIYLKFFVF